MTESTKSEVKESAAQLAGEALQVLAELMRASGSDQVRIAAARELLDRAHGRPKAEGGEGDGGPSYRELVVQSYKPEQA